MNKKIILEIGADGGSIAIYKIRFLEFTYTVLTDEGTRQEEVTSHPFSTTEKALTFVAEGYSQWHKLYLI